MAQYCEIAKTVTNCTDNCKICLEEEVKTREIKVGDRVQYIAEDPTTLKKPDIIRRKEQSEQLLELTLFLMLPHISFNGRKERLN